MDYEVIILGATFAAAGLACRYGEDCLIIERRPEAGYEFVNAMKSCLGYGMPLRSAEAKNLHVEFERRGAAVDGVVSLFDCATPLYAILNCANVLLNVEIVSVENFENGFEITVYGVSGYRTFTCNRIIDTRVDDSNAIEKTINVLVNSDTDAPLLIDERYIVEKTIFDGDVVVKCPVPPGADYKDAREAVCRLIDILPDGYKIVMVADMFDYVAEAVVYEDAGITYIPSAAFSNPVSAFDCGIMYGTEGLK